MTGYIIVILAFLATLVYASVVAFSIIGTHLYFYAYYNMKKSPIIGSVAIFMLAIAVDSSFWFYAVFIRFVNGDYPDWIIHPITLILVKGFVAVAIIRFVLFSIRKNDPACESGQKTLFK